MIFGFCLVFSKILRSNTSVIKSGISKEVFKIVCLSLKIHFVLNIQESSICNALGCPILLFLILRNIITYICDILIFSIGYHIYLPILFFTLIKTFSTKIYIYIFFLQRLCHTVAFVVSYNGIQGWSHKYFPNGFL